MNSRLSRPPVDARLELAMAESAVELRVALREHVEIDAVEDGHLHGGESTAGRALPGLPEPRRPAQS